MTRSLHTIIAGILLCPYVSQGRIWTDARDATRTFEGQLLELKDPFATILLANGKEMTLPTASLTPADRAYLTSPEAGDHMKQATEKKAANEAAAVAAQKSQQETLDKAAAAKAQMEAVKPLPVAPASIEPTAPAQAPKPGALTLALADKLVRLEGETLKSYRADADKPASRYLVLFAAQWSEKCQALAPLLPNFYQKTVQQIPGMELVLFSLDANETGQRAFLEKAGGGFPAVAHAHAGDASSFQLLNQHKGADFPQFVLMDASGKKLATFPRLPKLEDLKAVSEK
jgi:thiol-disulfide isomerase/thioredoxin